MEITYKEDLEKGKWQVIIEGPLPSPLPSVQGSIGASFDPVAGECKVILPPKYD